MTNTGINPAESALVKLFGQHAPVPGDLTELHERLESEPFWCLCEDGNIIIANGVTEGLTRRLGLGFANRADREAVESIPTVVLHTKDPSNGKPQFQGSKYEPKTSAEILAVLEQYSDPDTWFHLYFDSAPPIFIEHGWMIRRLQFLEQFPVEKELVELEPPTEFFDHTLQDWQVAHFNDALSSVDIFLGVRAVDIDGPEGRVTILLVYPDVSKFTSTDEAFDQIDGLRDSLQDAVGLEFFDILPSDDETLIGVMRIPFRLEQTPPEQGQTPDR